MICAIEQQLLRSRAEEKHWHAIFASAASAFRRAPDMETEAELHRSVSAGSENLYLRKLHLRVIDGYFCYLLENAAPHVQAQECLLRCSEAVLTGQTEEAVTALHSYFDLLSDCV